MMGIGDWGLEISFSPHHLLFASGASSPLPSLPCPPCPPYPDPRSLDNEHR